MSKKIEMPSKDTLLSLYKKPHVSITQLANHFNTSNPTIRKWLNYYEIDRKPHHIICKEVNTHKKAVRPSYDVLLKAYESNSIKQLETIFQCGQNTIYEWLSDYNIALRDISSSVKIGKKKQHANIQFSKEKIEEVYNKTTHIGIAAEELGISRSYLRTLKNKYDIETKIPWRSKIENELFEFVKTFDADCISNDRSIINPFELDIVSEKYKLAIEYCGLYWHSEYYGEKDRQYHRTKYLKCKERGYTLITVFESDDLEKVKTLIRHKINSNSIGARKTTVIELKTSDAKRFHETHHLHNAIGGTHHYGLIYDDCLLSVVSFHKSRFNKQYQYECGRMTFGNTRVIGGVSKLFKYFMQHINPSSIITYADLRFGEGDCYLHCDMKRQKDTPVNYWYFSKNNPTRVFSRVKFQKHKLKEQLDYYNENLTEYENMKNNNWDRIWDCGNAVYTFNK